MCQKEARKERHLSFSGATTCSCSNCDSRSRRVNAHLAFLVGSAPHPRFPFPSLTSSVLEQDGTSTCGPVRPERRRGRCCGDARDLRQALVVRAALRVPERMELPRGRLADVLCGRCLPSWLTHVRLRPAAVGSACGGAHGVTWRKRVRVHGRVPACGVRRCDIWQCVRSFLRGV